MARTNPFPRGELVVGGDFVANGYFKLAEETAENFRVVNGERWFYTGDIAEAHPDGTFKIVDRKKDLVKLPMGEYISLGKVEAAIKGSIFIENACVIADGMYSYIIAVISPSVLALKTLAQQLNKESLSIEQLCNDDQVIHAVQKSMKSVGKERGLTTLETPYKIKLCHEEWTPNNGLVTAALKIRRIQVRQYYEQDVKNMFVK